MSKTVRRRGFTLPEVLVTITIVAVLAAVVVPAVLNQVNKGDTAGLAGDVDALRSAISNFTTDTRQYPRTIKDLTTVITTARTDVFGAAYTTSAVNAWKGPYFPTSQAVGGATAYSTTAFGLTIKDTLETPAAGNANFITLVFGAQPTATQVATINRLFDGGDGTVPATDCATTPVAATGSATGNIRWTETDGVSGAPCVISALKWRLVSAAQ
jgi:prepilin-type N-terminal cleavage/methylation domain-containing protein